MHTQGRLLSGGKAALPVLQQPHGSRDGQCPAGWRRLPRPWDPRRGSQARGPLRRRPAETARAGCGGAVPRRAETSQPPHSAQKLALSTAHPHFTVTGPERAGDFPKATQQGGNSMADSRWTWRNPEDPGLVLSRARGGGTPFSGLFPHLGGSLAVTTWQSSPEAQKVPATGQSPLLPVPLAAPSSALRTHPAAASEAGVPRWPPMV